MRDAARSGYPGEVCGIVLGRDTAGGERVIERAMPVRNAQSEDRERRYLIPAGVVLSAERIAKSAGLEVIGFYHSHPEQPAHPSTIDCDLAWPWYTHLIISVRAGEPAEVRAWRLHDDRSGFIEEPLVVLETAGPEAAR